MITDRNSLYGYNQNLIFPAAMVESTDSDQPSQVQFYLGDSDQAEKENVIHCTSNSGLQLFHGINADINTNDRKQEKTGLPGISSGRSFILKRFMIVHRQ